MAEEATTPTTSTTPKGKTFNFSFTEEMFDYNTLKDLYEAQEGENEETVNEALEGLPDNVRALLLERMKPAPKAKELSQRQVFGRAIRDAMAWQEHLADVEAAEVIDIDGRDPEAA